MIKQTTNNDQLPDGQRSAISDQRSTGVDTRTTVNEDRHNDHGLGKNIGLDGGFKKNILIGS